MGEKQSDDIMAEVAVAAADVVVATVSNIVTASSRAAPISMSCTRDCPHTLDALPRRRMAGDDAHARYAFKSYLWCCPDIYAPIDTSRLAPPPR